LNEISEAGHMQKRGIGEALVSGLLLHIAILLLWDDSPSELFGLLTGIHPSVRYHDRVLQYPFVVLFASLFCWRTVALYRKRMMSVAMQVWYVVLALVLGWIWFFIALSQIQLSFIR
jgi:hypothetical protein